MGGGRWRHWCAAAAAAAAAAPSRAREWLGSALHRRDVASGSYNRRTVTCVTLTCGVDRVDACVRATIPSVSPSRLRNVVTRLGVSTVQCSYVSGVGGRGGGHYESP